MMMTENVIIVKLNVEKNKKTQICAAANRRNRLEPGKSEELCNIISFSCENNILPLCFESSPKSAMVC